MRAARGLLASFALLASLALVSACTPASSAPAEGSASPSTVLAGAAVGASPASPASPAAAGVPPASPSASPAMTPSGPAPTAPAPSATPGTAGFLAAAPVPTGPPLPANPFDLGGPAPVGSFVLGDSISLGVGPMLARLGYPVMGIVGQSASDTYLRTNLTTATAQAAPAWVIVLGTNNTADPADVARLAGWVDLIDSLRTPGDRQKVYWVTPHRPPSYIGSKSRWTLDAFNAELKRLDALHGWLRVIDFDAVAKAHPEWFDQDAAMHLHPDARGQGVLVALVAGPDAVPVKIPAPLLTGSPPATPEAEQKPETFDNSTLPPTPPTPMSTPVPLDPAPLAPSAEAPAPRDAAPSDTAPSDTTASATPG